MGAFYVHWKLLCESVCTLSKLLTASLCPSFVSPAQLMTKSNWISVSNSIDTDSTHQRQKNVDVIQHDFTINKKAVLLRGNRAVPRVKLISGFWLPDAHAHNRRISTSIIIMFVYFRLTHANRTENLISLTCSVIPISHTGAEILAIWNTIW